MPNISKIKVGNITYDLPCGEVITITSASGTLTQEVYNKIISSPFNKIKYLNKIYILQEENSTSYVYTSNYLTNGNRITITKSNRAISSGSLGALTSHYEAHNYIGAKDTQANGKTTNGNTYLKLYESGAKRSQFNIKGTGATTVTSDKDGNVTIHSSSPFLSLGLGQTTYPITGDFTEEQARHQICEDLMQHKNDEAWELSKIGIREEPDPRFCPSHEYHEIMKNERRNCY